MSEGNKHRPQLLASDERSFQLLVESVRDYAIFMLDTQGHVVSWNEGARLIKGYTREEILGSHFSRFYPQQQIDRHWPEYELEKAAEDGRFEDESWRVRKDGSLFWANVIITALRDEAGRLVGFSKVTRDLTERRRQSEALRQSEERFRILVEAVKDYAIFMLDPQGFVTTWNSGARQVNGYEADEIIGSHVSRFYSAEAVAQRLPDHELRIATLEGRFEDQGWRVRRDGSRFWASIVITALRDPAGKLIGFSKITRDMMDQRLHEQELAASEQRFRLLVEGVNDYAIIMLDPSGFVSSWNGGAERMSGYTSHEIIGRHFSHFYRTEDVSTDKPWQHMALARTTGRLMEENWRARKDGTLFWASTVITPLYDPERRLYGFAQVMQDLTERRQAEMLADTTQRMHEFIAMLAHELRNPLAPIRNAVELMGMKGLGDPTLESMRLTIDRQSLHLTHIIDELLDVNRIVYGKFAIAEELIDLGEVIARAVETTRPQIDRQQQQLDVELPPQALPVRGDSVRLTQAVVNLLNNAAKFTPFGGKISLAASRRTTDVEIRVRDNGKGIARADVDRIFDLFTQLESNPNGNHGGLGVGLALVRRIVELHGGAVQAASEGIGHGSEFTVRLPLPPQAPAASPAAASQAAAAPRMRVLVADDNRDAADSLRLMLEMMGQDVYTVYDGRDALTTARRVCPDLALLDIAMPNVSGYEVARELEGDPRSDPPVLVAITGWGQNDDKKRAYEAGFAYHFVKPIDQNELRVLLGKVSASRGKKPD